MPLARELKRRGHLVAFATARSLCPSIRKLGFRAFEVGLDWLAGTTEIPGKPRAPRSNGNVRPSFYREINEGFCGPTVFPFVKDLLKVVHDWKPSVVVRDPFEFGAYVVAEKLGIPHATVCTFYLDREVWASCAGKNIADVQRALGLTPDRNLKNLYRYLVLNLAPFWFFGPASNSVPTAHELQPPVFDRSLRSRAPSLVRSLLPDKPTIYFTMGTVVKDITVYKKVIQALKDEPLNLIVGLGDAARDGREFQPLPPNVVVAGYIPQSAVMPIARLVISHGGYNTVMAALRAGLPQLIIPMFGDQPFHASSCNELGIGLAIQPNSLRPNLIRRTVQKLLREPYVSNARLRKRSLLALPGNKHAVDLLIRLARTKEPVQF